MLDFYRQHAISPVRQIVDVETHARQRAHLYRSLGLAPNAFTDKIVLEIGPGSPENARYIRSLKPARYFAVEPNHTAVEQLRAARIFDHVLECPIEDATIAPRGMDIVLCEGLLGLCGSDPAKLLEHAFNQVKPGGVLVITCIDAISDHAEVLRRALAHQALSVFPKNTYLTDQVACLRPIFTPHLATLKGMTRSADDWIMDNLLNPASIGPTFSIPDALTQLEGRAEVLGCNPRFLMDFRWYKDADPGNQWAIEAYWSQAHNLLDYRRVTQPRTHEENTRLMWDCLTVRKAVALMEQGVDITLDTSLVVNDPGWFGRGQQYMSFVNVQ